MKAIQKYLTDKIYLKISEIQRIFKNIFSFFSKDTTLDINSFYLKMNPISNNMKKYFLWAKTSTLTH